MQEFPDLTTADDISSLNTMSVAVLTPALLHTMPPMASPAKKPKLSLDTTSTAPTFGRSKHSNSLRLDTLSATSPTMRNTFGNSYASLKSLDGTSSRRRIALTPRRLEYDVVDSPVSVNDSPISPIKTYTTTTTAPYDVSFHISSILRNGPVKRRERRKLSLVSKPTFASPTKKVVFRAPLTEEVKNQIYTFAHSDIEPPTPTVSTLDLTTQDVQEMEVDDGQLLQPTTYQAEPRRSRLSLAVDNESCPATPVAGRSKQERQWQWTLGPVEGSVAVS